MSTLFDIIIGGSSAADFDNRVVELEVEENIDLPGAFSLTLPVAATATGDYDTLSDKRLAPLSNIAVTAQAADGQVHCLIDGYVLSQAVHLDTGTTQSSVKVWGQDASWLMNITEKLYDADFLNPTHVEAQIGLRVLTADELQYIQGALGTVARTASGYSQALRQVQARANLANTTESIIGMLPI